MRRDYIDVDVRVPDSEDTDDRPTLAIDFDGPEGLLSDRLTAGEGRLDADEVDVTYRLQTPLDAEDASGVLSLSNSVTGEFLLEADAAPGDVVALVEAAKGSDGEETSYRVRLTDETGETVVYDKETLLVYDADGSLMRGESLIPGGVEL